VFDGLEDDGEQQRRDAAEAMPRMVEKEGQHCMGEVGHEGRHRYRRILPATDGLH
jgi:hypothetical protein